MDERATQGEFLLHTTGKFSGFPIFEWFDLGIDILDQVVVFVNCGLEDGCEKIKVFLDTQILVERKTSRHISNRVPDFLVVFHNVKAIDTCAALIRKNQGGQHSEEACLACTIRAN